MYQITVYYDDDSLFYSSIDIKSKDDGLRRLKELVNSKELPAGYKAKLIETRIIKIAVDPRPREKCNDTVVWQVPEHSRAAELLIELLEEAKIEHIILKKEAQ